MTDTSNGNVDTSQLSSGWQLSSGNFTDYDFTITQAYFATDAAYNNGDSLLLQLIGIDGEGNEAKEIYSIGKDWVSYDGGATCQSTKGVTRIPRNSMYGKFIASIVTLGPDAIKAFEGRGDANTAAVWAGAVFHMDEVEFNWGKGLNPSFRNVPSAFLGFAGAGAAQVAQATPAQAAPAPAQSVTPPLAQSAPHLLTPAEAAKQRAAVAKANVAAANSPTPAPTPAPPSAVDSSYTGQLLILAQTSPDFSTFVDAALELPGVTDDDAVVEMVIDPSEAGYFSLNHAS